MSKVVGVFSRVRVLLPFVRKYWHTYATLLLLSVLAIGLSLILPLILRVLIDDVFVHKNLALLNYVMVGLLVITILQLLDSLLIQYAVNWLGQTIAQDIRIKVFEHLE